MKIFKVFSAATLIITLAVQGYAHRPTNTEDAGVGPLGEIEIQGAYEQTRDKGVKEHAGFYTFILGLERAVVGVEGRYLKTPEGEKGLSDMLFFTKILLIGKDEKSGMFTFKGEFLTTSGNEKKGLGGRNQEYAGSAVFTKSLSKFSFDFQAGYNYVRGGIAEDNFYFGGCSIDFALTEKFSLTGEIFGIRSKGEKPLKAGGGFMYEAVGGLVIDFIIHKGINESANDWFFSTGFTLKF